MMNEFKKCIAAMCGVMSNGKIKSFPSHNHFATNDKGVTYEQSR